MWEETTERNIRSDQTRAAAPGDEDFDRLGSSIPTSGVLLIGRLAEGKLLDKRLGNCFYYGAQRGRCFHQTIYLEAVALLFL